VPNIPFFYLYLNQQVTNDEMLALFRKYPMIWIFIQNFGFNKNNQRSGG